MLQQWIQSTWFWPLLGAVLLAYYFWVYWVYFRSGFRLFEVRNSRSLAGRVGRQSEVDEKIHLSPQELEMGLKVHEKLLKDPEAALSGEELTLLKTSPLGGLIGKSSNT